MAFNNRNPHHGRQTIKWSSHSAEIFNQDCAISQWHCLQDALSALSQIALPSEAIAAPWIDSGIKTDVSNMIQGHAPIIRTYLGYKNLSGPYLRRLVQLKEYAVANWPRQEHLTPSAPVPEKADKADPATPPVPLLQGGVATG